MYVNSRVLEKPKHHKECVNVYIHTDIRVHMQYLSLTHTKFCVKHSTIYTCMHNNTDSGAYKFENKHMFVNNILNSFPKRYSYI